VHIDVEVTDEAFVHDCGTSLHTYVCIYIAHTCV